MARNSQRESVLLGYSPQGALMMNNPSNSPKSSTCQRNSDNIDFSDVFGGPPRRSSLQEMRYSIGYNTDSSVDDETVPVHRQRWSGLGEKPVFGDEVGSRRRYPSEDFFDDIFKGNECLSSSSPRKHDNSRDVFGSSPSSRVLSPAFPLPPKSEPFGSRSPPAQFSLSAKLIKGTDLPTFGSSSRNLYKSKDEAPTGSAYAYSPLSRSSCQGQGELIRQSSFSGELSFSKEEPSNLTKPDGTDNSNYSQRHSYGSDVATNGNQFHFSFYKWAGKGMPLPIPFRGGNSSKFKEKHKLERCSSANGRIAYETVAREITSAIPINADSASFMCSAPPDSNSREKDLKKQENGSIDNTGNRGRVEQCQSDDTALPSNIKSETPITHQVIAEDVPGDTIQTSGEGTKTNIVPDTVSSGRTEVKTSAVTQEDAKNELKLLCSLFYDHDNEQSIKVTARKSESKVIKVKSTKKSSAVYDIGENVKLEDGKVTTLLGEDVHKAYLQGSLTNSPHNLGKNRARGKVKEFVKIFDQDASNDTKSDVKSQNLKSMRKERSKFRTEHDARVRKNETREKMHSPKVNKNSTPAASLEDDEFPHQSEKLHYESKTSKNKSTDIYSGHMDSSNSNSASIPDGPEAIIDDTDETFQIDDLFQDEDILPQVEEIQDIDAKIRKWSNGKEGNIRSLLSTLQYVLWPGSGWKPVPLVNIIEGNAVKRSYQKALLYLHPDKLQQKGATTQQKYIAERVFNILQEAWTHFNSLGSV